MNYLTKEQQKQADDRFRELCKEYETNKSKAIWDELWMLVNQAAEATVKSMLKGVNATDIDELITDTTINTMNKIKKEYEKNNHFELKYKLVTFCRSYALYPLYKPSKKMEDRCLSLEGWQETHANTITTEDDITYDKRS